MNQKIAKALRWAVRGQGMDPKQRAYARSATQQRMIDKRDPNGEVKKVPFIYTDTVYLDAGCGRAAYRNHKKEIRQRGGMSEASALKILAARIDQ